MRIVSLLPAATEIVYALGADDHLVGVSFECDEPARARTEHPVVVSGRDTSGMTPGEIDAWVRGQRGSGADLYHLDRDALADAAPDVVLTQDLCAVCAAPAAGVEQALDFLGCRAEVVRLDPGRLDDVLAGITTVGTAVGADERAAALVSDLRGRLAAVAAAVSGRTRPRVAVLEWVDPPFSSGHWVPDMVRAAGGEPLLAESGARSHPMPWDVVAAAGAEVVVVAPCGFGLDGAAGQAATVAARLPGVAVWAIDGNGLVVRPGPRLVDGVEALAALLHPGAVPARPDAVRRVA